MTTRTMHIGIPTLYAGESLFSLPLRSSFMTRLAEAVYTHMAIDPSGSLRCYTRYRAHMTEEMLERVQGNL